MAARNYIDNAELYRAFVSYRAKCRAAALAGGPEPRIPDYIGKCFMLIAQNLATARNFAGYGYRDELIGDAIENCVMVAKSFDPDRSKYPFAYFTRVAWNAFIRRINREQKQRYVRYKTTTQAMIDGTLSTHQDGDSGVSIDVDQSKMNDFIESFERKLVERKTKRKTRDDVRVDE